MEVRDPYGYGDVSFTADSYYIDDPVTGDKVRVTDTEVVAHLTTKAHKKRRSFITYDGSLSRCFRPDL